MVGLKVPSLRQIDPLQQPMNSAQLREYNNKSLSSKTQSQRGEDRRGSLPRRRHRHDARCARRNPIRLHLCGSGQAQGDEQEDDVYQVFI